MQRPIAVLLDQKAMNNRSVVQHRRRCEATLYPQIFLVLVLEFSQRRVVTNRIRTRDDPLIPQMNKKP